MHYLWSPRILNLKRLKNRNEKSIVLEYTLHRFYFTLAFSFQKFHNIFPNCDLKNSIRKTVDNYLSISSKVLVELT
ncbi:hypothetical protein C2G38_656109 [Gigaspora rosea]|uniref:Uncharacterized protein n=1 Tax=Gigaspora rosea TaxID=44941 RepID=A0A397UCC7_9GLOM|nr:hypothetical protein C2G38_656109 [Gigaspora rosea]